MSVVSLPVTRPVGRVLIVANPAMQTQPMQLMQQLGFECHVSPDPYAAMAEICGQQNTYRSVVFSLQSLYREEIVIIGSLRRRFPQLEIWLTHTDGRQAAQAQAFRLGADGLLADDGLHRVAASPISEESLSLVRPSQPALPADLPNNSETETSSAEADEASVGEPVLTADELRALLQEQPSMPPASGSEN